MSNGQSKMNLNELAQTISDNVAIRMRHEKLSINKLCQETGLSRNTISNILNKPVMNVSIQTLAKIAKALECEPYELLKPIKF